MIFFEQLHSKMPSAIRWPFYASLNGLDKSPAVVVNGGIVFVYVPLTDHGTSMYRDSGITCDVMTFQRFPYYWPFVREIHRSPVDSPHKGPVLQS